jgi:hypothetical protein
LAMDLRLESPRQYQCDGGLYSVVVVPVYVQGMGKGERAIKFSKTFTNSSS